jgi:hypothetical protein
VGAVGNDIKAEAGEVLGQPRALLVLDAVGRGGVEDEFSRGPQQVPYWGLCNSDA